MVDPTAGRPKYVKVKDSSGNEWLCPLDALKRPRTPPRESWTIVWSWTW